MGINTAKPMKKKSGPVRFLKVLLGLFILVGLVYSLQYFFHVLDSPLKTLNKYLSATNGIIFKEMIWGISTGTLLFIAILIIFPIFMKNINTRSYFKNLYSGILSSFIFFISQWIYKFCEKIGKFYLVLSMAGLSIITLILIGFIARAYKKEADKVEFRTQYIASITAGLIFGILLQLFSMGIGWVKSGFSNIDWLSLH
jgi:hypothetical protein